MLTKPLDHLLIIRPENSITQPDTSMRVRHHKLVQVTLNLPLKTLEPVFVV